MEQKTVAAEEQKREKKAEEARLREIVSVLAKHNVLLDLAEQSHPENVREAFEELGPTFIKIGQILSVRTDIVSPSFAEEFKKLQDGVPSDDFTVIGPCIEGEAGVPLKELFQSIEEKPLASASIGQVHTAVLKNGKNVVVKVQHPGIYEEMCRDVSLLEKAVPLIEHVHAAGMTDPAAVVAELKDSLMNELDFTREAENIERFHQLNQNVPYIQSPRAYRQYSTKKLLIMDFMSGTKVSDYAAASQKDETSRRLLAKEIVDNYMKQIFDDGYFHADPHPGNLLITEAGEPPRDPKVVYIDFGMMGTLDEATVEKFNRVLAALTQRDSSRIAQALLGLCKAKEPVDLEDFTADVDGLFNRYYDLPIGDMSLPVIFEEITRLCTKYRLQLPRNIILLAKGIGTIEGIVLSLDPGLSIMSAVTPYAKRYLQKQIDPKAEMKDILKDLYSALRSTPKLPAKLIGVLDTVSRGEMKVSMEHKNLDDLSARLERMVNRLVMGLITAALIIGSSMLLNTAPGPMQSVTSALGITGLILALALAGAMIFKTYHKK